MTITTHVCRGNFRSTFISSGGYEPVAESLLGKCNYDGYFLEYDTDRAGGFEPLRFLPKGNKIVVLGLDHLEVGAAGAARRTSRSVSRRRPNTSRSISFACRRNAALPRPRKATCWPKPSNGRSCAWWSRWRTRCGAASTVVPAKAGTQYRREALAMNCGYGSRPSLRSSRERTTDDPTHHAALPRRPCRQPAAHRAAERGARQACQGRDRRRGPEGSRGPRDREDRQEAGRGRPQARDRRRVPPLLVAFRFLLGPARASRRSARRRSSFTASTPKPRRSRSPARSISSAIRRSSISSSSRALCKVTPKMCIPAPSTFHFRQGRAMMSKQAYPGYDEFFADVAAAWRKAIRAFYDAGCRYLQLDDTAWAMICDPKEREGSKARGDDPDSLPAIYARVTNAGARRQAGRHGDHHAFLPRQFPLHLHRLGRLRVRRRASARRTPISTAISWNTTATAPAASSRCAISPRARSSLCSGWSRRKSGRLERKDDIKRRIDEATKYRRARPALPVAAMRLRLDRGGQRAGRGRAVGQAAHDRGTGRRGVGKVVIVVPAKAGTHTLCTIDGLRSMKSRPSLSLGQDDKSKMTQRTHAPLPRRSCRQPAAHRRR